MKIYVLPVNEQFKPASGFRAPAHNADFGIEQDFSLWLTTHSELLTYDAKEADWHYLPIFWNRYYCNYWGSDESVEQLQAEILRLVSRNVPTFTICEYDVISMQPFLDLCNMQIFSASRHSNNGCIDVPLLCSRHQELPYKTERRWLASFMGKFETHGIREEMRQALQGRNDVYLSESKDTQAYIELMADSYIALSPRGYGGQSFRFYEAMQFGCVPMLISDVDTRPFKKWIDWDDLSLYADNSDLILDTIDWYNRPGFLLEMGQKAKAVFEQELYYGQWGKYVIRQLQEL